MCSFNDRVMSRVTRWRGWRYAAVLFFFSGSVLEDNGGGGGEERDFVLGLTGCVGLGCAASSRTQGLYHINRTDTFK